MQLIVGSLLSSTRLDPCLDALAKFAGVDPALDRRLGYFEALKRIQPYSFSLPTGDHPLLTFSFDGQDLETIQYLLQEDDFDPTWLLPDVRRHQIEGLFVTGYELVERSLPEQIRVIDALIANVMFVRQQSKVGGSAGELFGVLWLDPPETWTALDYAATLVHEAIHQILFLDDMVFGLFSARPDELDEDPEGKAVSAILKISRRYDLAFHAACVAGGLLDFFVSIGNVERGDEMARDLEGSLADLERGRRFLTERGERILDELVERAAADPAPSPQI